MATTEITKVTKAMKLDIIDSLISACENSEYPIENVTYDDLHDFIAHEKELMNKKAESAKERAEKKKLAGDELRAQIVDLLTDVPKTADEIVKAIGDPDVSTAMVIARMTSAINAGLVGKEQVPVEGTSRKVMAYFRKSEG